MKRIAILGPGLLGGSIALRLRELGGWHVSLWARRQQAVDEILLRGCADQASNDLRAVVENADVLVFCVPVGAMTSLAQQCRKLIRADALITDVGSVKEKLVTELVDIFQGHGRFVGSHPMAGSEATGIDAAKSDLFVGKTCIVTPAANTDPVALQQVTEFWKQLGCKNVRHMSPGDHDESVALISHLPHLLAATLVNTVADNNTAAFEVVGPGFRDSTRVASGPSAMWEEILAENSEAVIRAMDAIIAKLATFRQTLAESSSGAARLQIRSLLESAQNTRDRIFPKKK